MASLFQQIEKPTLLLNEDVARKNIKRMVAKAAGQNLRFRPHFKTHQSAQIGEWFREEGVRSITVSSVDMAQYFADHGWDDITIAFSANLRQAPALDELAGRLHLGLLVESEETARGLAGVMRHPVDVWLKVDVGAHRTGLAWDQPEAAARVAAALRAEALRAEALRAEALHAEALHAGANFRLRGLLTHAGHTYGARGIEEVCQRYRESTARLDWLRSALQAQGVGPLEISVGDTPGASLCPDLGPEDEIRPGNFVFYDAMQVRIGSCDWQDVAVALACPVVARHPERGEIVVYGGAVHLSKDYLIEGERRIYGDVCLPEGDHWSAPLPGAYVSALSQEHGILHVAEEDFHRLQVGDLVCILPAHSCLTVTLMKRYLTLSGKIIDTLNV